ncbi:unnamed protein product [Discosporangium mesarthrocarpum]
MCSFFLWRSFLTDLSGANIEEDLLSLFCNMGGESPLLGDSMSSAAPADPAFWVLHPTAERLWQWRRVLGMSNDTWPDGSYVHKPWDCWGHAESDLLPMGGVQGGGAWGDTDFEGYTNGELYKLMDPLQSFLPYVYEDFEWPHCQEEGLPLDLNGSEQ